MPPRAAGRLYEKADEVDEEAVARVTKKARVESPAPESSVRQTPLLVPSPWRALSAESGHLVTLWESAKRRAWRRRGVLEDG